MCRFEPRGQNGDKNSRNEIGGHVLDGDPVEPGAEVFHVHPRVDVGGQAWVRMAKDPLCHHHRRARAGEQGSGRATEIVEPKRPGESDGPEVEAALRARKGLIVRAKLREAAALAAARPAPRATPGAPALGEGAAARRWE